jgi:hypothetical protein
MEWVLEMCKIPPAPPMEGSPWEAHQKNPKRHPSKFEVLIRFRMDGIFVMRKI